MVKRMNLRTRIYIVLITLVLITVSGGAIMVWYTYRIQGFLNTVIDKNVATFQAAEALEIALVNQKGFVSYYYLDKDPEWLKLLGEYRQVFKERLEEVHLNIGNKGEKEAISRIESEYMRYIDLKDEVIRHYKEGSLNTATRLHREVRDLFFEVLELTEDFKEMVLTQINEARDHTLSQTRRLRIISGIAVTNVFLLGTLLVAILSGQIFVPLRRLASEADVDGGEDESENEVQAVSRSITGLMRDAAHSRSQLEKSQEILLQSEKMALVGKLAAGTAHSIRNPLTSVKMRLFSLSKSLKLNAYQKEDFDVISTEINHIDTILENFLEFSRPAKLKMQRVNPAHVVDMALKLLQHRLQSYHVDVELDRQGSLPDIQADPDQLKEVLVNIIVNACEAMEGGGLIIIGERMTLKKSLGQIVEIRIKDNGPGIPEPMQGEVFQPFFSTKEEGTGLGLSIATRIIEQHGGLLEVTSNLGEGTTFMISLPMKETGIE